MGKHGLVSLLIASGLASSCARAPTGAPEPPTIATSTRPALELPLAWTATPAGGSTTLARSKQTATPTVAPLPTRTLAPGAVTILGTFQMWSATDGWAIARSTESTYPGVFRTSDGGRTWREVTPAAAPLCFETWYCDLSSLGPRRAWVVVQSPGDNPDYPDVDSMVTVYSTGDGGQNWYTSRSFRIQQGFPDAPVFIDPIHGWMLITLVEFHSDYAVEIRRTGDGGSTWQLASRTEPFMDDDRYPDTPGGLPVNCIKNGISFVDELAGWATGDCLIEDLFLYVTADGGSTWAPRQTLPIPDGLPPNAFERWYSKTHPPVFFPGRQGYMVVELYGDIDGSASYVYTTIDGGIHWEPHSLPGAGQLLEFISLRQGWMNADGRIYGTSDGGLSWSALGRYPGWQELGWGLVDFVDSSHGWIVRGDRVDATKDGGATWQTFTPMLAPSP